jgi:hypothetical protein
LVPGPTSTGDGSQAARHDRAVFQVVRQQEVIQ